MTYFLNEKPGLPPNPMVPDIDPTSMLEGIGAAFQKSALENDANFRVSREKSVEYRGMSLSAGSRIGIETIYQEGIKRGLFESAAAGNRAPPRTVEEALAQDWRAGKFVLDLAREQAAANPEAWADLDLSDEGVDARVNERLQAEHRDLSQTLEAMPNGRSLAELVGGIGGMTADVKNIPFLFIGGGTGGSLLKVFAREAVANMAAEGVNLPAQFGMADRLEIPEPDVLSQLTMAAVGGGILGVAAEGFTRGVTYFMGRNAVKPPPGVSPSAYEVQLEVAEDALARGENPLDAVQRVMDDFAFDDPRTLPEPREPLVPRSVTATTPAPTPSAPEPITTQTLPPRQGEAPRTNNELAAMAETAINEADALRQGAVGNRRFPFLQALKKAGVRINPDSPEGQELRNMGITARTMPGLFSRKAAGERTALDTLVASEWDETFPGLWDATRTSRDTSGAGGLYLDRDGVFDVIRREQAGDLNWIRSVADADKMARDADAALRGAYDGPSEVDDFTSGARAEGGFYFDPPNPFGDDFRLRFDEAKAGIGDFAFRNGIRDLLPSDIDEIARELAEYGGDGKFLIERAISREIEEIKRGMEAPNGTARTAGGENRGGQQPPQEPAPASRAEGAAGGRAVEPQGTERTDAGIQYVAPGIAPISDRARLEAQQSRPMRGGNRAMDDGLFDAASRAQMDMFSDPIGPKSRPMQDAMIEDLRDAITKNVTSTVSVKTIGGVDVEVASGRFTALHGYSGRESLSFEPDYSGPRYQEGNIYGDRGVYLDGDGKWTGSNPNWMFSVERVAEVEVDFNRALILSPDTATSISAAARGRSRLASGSDIAAWAERNGFDGIIVTGFDRMKSERMRGIPDDYIGDDPAILARISEAEKAPAQLGLDPDAAQDQIVAFRPEAIRVVRDNLPAGQRAPQIDLALERAREQDFTVDLMDGRGERPVSSLLDEIDQDDEFMAVLDACGTRRTE